MKEESKYKMNVERKKYCDGVLGVEVHCHD